MTALRGTTTAVASQVKDFSGRSDPVQFRVNDDVFNAAPNIPTHSAFRLMDMAKSIGNDEVETEEQFQRLVEFFELVLMQDSAKVFVDGLSSTEKPIGIRQCLDIMQWLMGEWGLRPTRSSSDSQTQPEETGPSSTDGVPDTE